MSVWALGVLFFSLFRPWSSEAGCLRCYPEKVYRGESFTVELPVPHDGYELSILGNGMEEYVMSFERLPIDKIGPVIPADSFAKMQRIEISTATAKGSSSIHGRQDDLPRTSSQPRKIFLKTGPYEVIVGPPLSAEYSNPDACWIEYFDYPRPKRADAKSRSDQNQVSPSLR